MPQPELYREYSRDLQEGRPGSTLELYKTALALRTELALGEGSLDWLPEFCRPTTLGYQNGNTLVIHNFGPAPIDLPAGEIILVSQNGLTGKRELEPDQTVWITAAV